MSTLPFLLSVADELDNLNSQTYMDDFGLGFHPHRHYYRNPNHSIQLSLPASTDWIEEKQRCRNHKFVNEAQAANCNDEGNSDVVCSNDNRSSNSTTNDEDDIDNTVNMHNLSKKCRKYNYKAIRHRGDSNSKLTHKSTPEPTSSSDESLQKTSTLSSLASIEFLTCFPVKKNKTPKNTHRSTSGHSASTNKKSS